MHDLLLTPGSRIDQRYEIVETIGSGSAGTVVHVLDRELDRQSFALKVMHGHIAADFEAVRRFSAEAIVTRQLTHQNIARVYDVISTSSSLYLVMEYIEGCNLEHFLNGCSQHKVSLDEALYLLEQLLRGLTAAHQIDIVHRDIKPSNVLIDSAGVVKLADFGLATSLTSPLGLTRTGELLGTPSYMAPEQFSGAKGDVRSDLYAFAMVAIEMLLGRPAFTGDTILQVMHQHRTCEMPLAELRSLGTPEWLLDIVAICGAKDPKERILSAAQIAARIKQERTAERTPQMESAIKSVVKRRRVDRGIMPQHVKQKLRTGWIAFMLLLASLLIYDSNSRQRFALALIPLRQEFGISIKSVFQTFGFSGVSDITGSELLAAVADGNKLAAKMLLASGVDPNTRTVDGKTALELFSFHDVPLLKLLLEYNVELEGRNSQNDTPLLVAAKQQLPRQFGLLLRAKASPLAVDTAGNSVVHIAVATLNRNVLDQILGNVSGTELLRLARLQNLAGDTPLHLAAIMLNPELVEVLLLTGFDPNVRDRHGRTPVGRLMQSRRTQSAEQVALLLLKRGALLSPTDDSGMSVRTIAADSGFGWDSFIATHAAELAQAVRAPVAPRVHE